MNERNYDFRLRHWEFHKPGRRDPSRKLRKNEVMITPEWSIGVAPDCDYITETAARDFRDYLEKSMDISLRIVHADAPKVLWIEHSPKIDKGFVIEAEADHIRVAAAEDRMTLRGTIHLEDIMNLEGIPAVRRGKMVRKPLYKVRIVHSGTGLDVYPDAELMALLHAGYDSIQVFCEGIDRNHIGYCDFNDIITRAARLGIQTFFHNYIRTYIHPDEDGAQEKFDAAYGELFRRYPGLGGIGLCGESLEFPSRDPATTGKPYNKSVIDGIPDTRPSPGWYPCEDYPAYVQCIERAVHKYKPDAEVLFSTYNWGYAPLELRRKFLQNYPKNVGLSVCYEIFSQRKLEGLYTPVMDYTISADEPGYYFESECAEAHRQGIPITGNVNTAGIAWDFGCVPLVPAPEKLLTRNLHLREAKKKWNVSRHYTTHHYGWWNSVAADLGKWTAWEDYEPDYDELLTKIAIRDYGKKAAPHVRSAWKYWSEAMDHYTASNEDQYGPWRVGAAYPFIFQPNISRTMSRKDINFPTAPDAHFGGGIVKTFYTPYENAEQTPGFLRYPAELRSLNRMLKLWNQGLAAAAKAVEAADPAKRDEARRLEALGHFIRNSIRTTIHIKQWWLSNMAMQTSTTAEEAEKHLDQIEKIAHAEIENAEDTIPVVEFDSRLGWEPSMEYVCDKWHLEWKIRQVKSALRETAAYRRMLRLHRNTKKTP
ncbi:MAG: hypothetical protein GX927_01875 [Lentisphaerae bacterium]|jgi:hypothetical protein|nr:hypothetical protein [Lentisphaerota bacterium]